jgi:predicted dehydrogenase
MGANERLRVGVIGCGAIAQGHFQALRRIRETDNIDLVAVCDVYEKRLAEGAKITGGKPVQDYRTVLSENTIDYVTIAVPEHWHMQMVLEAADAGKHIYCEKPMTRTIEQSRRIVHKLRENDKIRLQVGVQGTSDDSYAKAYELIKGGAIGEVVLAQIDYSRNTRGPHFLSTYRETDPDVKPETLDWKAWLGPAPKKPFDPDRFMHWREYWDYSGGISSDLFVHRITRMIKALGLTFPEYVAATGGQFYFRETTAEIPDTLDAVLQYPGGLVVRVVSSMASGAPIEHMIRGNKATLIFNRNGFVVRPEPMYAKEVKPVEFRKTGAEDQALHHRNLANAIRKNEPLNCDMMTGYYGVVASEMINESYRKRKYLRWDAQREKPVKA